MHNPFIGMTVGAWVIFLGAYMVTEFKPWAWMLWVPWLLFVTIAPIIWWLGNRKKTRGNNGTD